MGSYAYAKHLLNTHNDTKVRMPLVVWQHGKSFRREQDQPTKFMRLKEFHQLEFQCIYSLTTGADYAATSDSSGRSGDSAVGRGMQDRP